VPTESEFSRILQWPGYLVYRLEIDERNKAIDLWVRRKRGNRKLECSGCGRKYTDAYDSRERAVRDLPWSAFQATVHIEIYRVKCEECGVRIEKVPLLPIRHVARSATLLRLRYPLAGRELRSLPLVERKHILRTVVPDPPAPVLYVEHFDQRGVDLFRATQLRYATLGGRWSARILL
jgi:hypothetical protein